MTVAKSKSAKLRLYTEEAPKAAPQPIEAIASLPDVLRNFGLATGWSLKYAPSHSGRGVGCGIRNPRETKNPPREIKNPPARNQKSLSWSAPVSPGVGAPLGHLRL